MSQRNPNRKNSMSTGICIKYFIIMPAETSGVGRYKSIQQNRKACFFGYTPFIRPAGLMQAASVSSSIALWLIIKAETITVSHSLPTQEQARR
jgi:hypothetical protein